MIRRAFTLVELLVVISIIGLLSTIAIVSMNGSRDKARIASGQSFEQSIFQKFGDRLEAEWPFDAAPGGITPDISGNGHTGTVTNPALVAGMFGSALSFTGSSWVEVGPMDISNGITVSAWIYPTVSGQSGFIIGKLPVNSQWEFMLEGGLIIWRGGATVNNNASCPEPSTNTWHNVVGTQYGTQASVYIDGHRCVTATIPAIGDSAGNVEIGTFGPGAYRFNGLIDQLRVYSGSVLEP